MYLALKLYVLCCSIMYLCMHRSYLDTLDSISASGGVAKKNRNVYLLMTADISSS